MTIAKTSVIKKKCMGRVELILGTFLTTWAGGGGNLCYLIRKIYVIIVFFSLIKLLEHFKIFTFYIIEKNFLILKIGEI